MYLAKSDKIINEFLLEECINSLGSNLTGKQDNVVWIYFDFFNSLRVFTESKARMEK